MGFNYSWNGLNLNKTTVVFIVAISRDDVRSDIVDSALVGTMNFTQGMLLPRDLFECNLFHASLHVGDCSIHALHKEHSLNLLWELCEKKHEPPSLHRKIQAIEMFRKKILRSYNSLCTEPHGTNSGLISSCRYSISQVFPDEILPRHPYKLIKISRNLQPQQLFFFVYNALTTPCRFKIRSQVCLSRWVIYNLI